MNSKTRVQHHRRDRRKAKQSEYAREGKTNFSHVGHGNIGLGGPSPLHLDMVYPFRMKFRRKEIPTIKDERPGFMLLAERLGQTLGGEKGKIK